jgi:hypothetical protein
LFCVEKIVDWSNSNDPIEVIMVALMKNGGLTKEDVAKKLPKSCVLVQMKFLFF